MPARTTGWRWPSSRWCSVSSSRSRRWKPGWRRSAALTEEGRTPRSAAPAPHRPRTTPASCSAPFSPTCRSGSHRRRAGLDFGSAPRTRADLLLALVRVLPRSSRWLSPPAFAVRSHGRDPADRPSAVSTGSVIEGHGGDFAVAAAQAHGVTTLFTLSGAHVFPMYEGAVRATPAMRILDVRHEPTAVFAAEATEADPETRSGRAHGRPRRDERRKRHRSGAVLRLASRGHRRPGPHATLGHGQPAELDHLRCSAP